MPGRCPECRVFRDVPGDVCPICGSRLRTGPPGQSSAVNAAPQPPNLVERTVELLLNESYRSVTAAIRAAPTDIYLQALEKKYPGITDAVRQELRRRELLTRQQTENLADLRAKAQKDEESGYLVSPAIDAYAKAELKKQFIDLGLSPEEFDDLWEFDDVDEEFFESLEDDEAEDPPPPETFEPINMDLQSSIELLRELPKKQQETILERLLTELDTGIGAANMEKANPGSKDKMRELLKDELRRARGHNVTEFPTRQP